MIRNVLAATAVAVMAGSALGANGFLFPSATPPGDHDPQTIPQYVSFIWDDNGYSGEEGTIYEPKAGEVDYADWGHVGGMQPNWDGQGGLKPGGKNPLSINEGGMGLSWAVKTLGAKMSGAGTGHMTFNMISGLMIPSWVNQSVKSSSGGENWQCYESKYGSQTEGLTPAVKAKSGHYSIAIAWGRENQIGTAQGGTEVQISYMNKGINKMLAAGHEIGNHTVDHLETNSIWPEDKWPNAGDGFDNGDGLDMLGNPWNEQDEFGGQNPYVYEQGWRSGAGYKLQQQTWKEILTLGEQDHANSDNKEKITIPSSQGSRLQGFRAPRLEINSNMFSALSEKGYLYDCGVEEGMEQNVDGSNFLWPYTVDNGVPNFFTKQQLNETVYATSFPTVADGSVWEIPVNLMIVPEDIRVSVLEGHNKLRVDGEGNSALEMKDWDGKITGFDFNMFILWAMKPEHVLATMKNTLDLHYDNNRAPMQVGAHTDYFTPMYDFATLDGDGAFKYALPKYNSGHGNTWTERKKVFEDFVDYAKGKSGVEFVSGYELIQNIKALQASGVKPGTSYDIPAAAEWNFLNDGVNSVDNAGASNFSGGSINGEIDLKVSDDASKKYAYSSYYLNIKGGLTGLTHMSLNYNSDTPLKLRLYVEGDMAYLDGVKQDHEAAWEVTINNLNKDVFSGEIPVSAFGYNAYSLGINESIDLSKVYKIEVAPTDQGEICKFNISDIKTYGVAANIGASPITKMGNLSGSTLAVHSIANNKLNLEVPSAGQYSVDIFSTSGRLVKSVNHSTLVSGMTSIDMTDLSTGVYMLRVNGADLTLTSKLVLQ